MGNSNVSKRLLKLYSNASQETLQEGLSWYFLANKNCKDISKRYKTPHKTVCQVMAILSPACSWEINKRDCKELVKAYYRRGVIGAEGCKVSTYGTNKRKAIAVLQGVEEFKKTRTNFKTFSFYKNIYTPTNKNYCTIDRHAVKAFKGILKGGSVALSPKAYKATEKAYKRLARHLNILPQQAQAVVWTQYKIETGR
jgi:hypothetical protein